MKTLTRSMHRSLLMAAILGLTAASSHAALITWGAAQNITGDADVSTTGALVRALNIGSDAGSAIATSTTINGVIFDPFAVPFGTPSVTVGNFTLATAAPAGLSGANGSSLAAPFSSLSASYRSLLGSAGTASNSGFPMTLTMSGLTVGQSYSFEWWANLSGATDPTDVTTGTAGNSITLDENTSNASGGRGQFALGTFIADAASQSVSFSGTPSSGPILNGFQLRQLAPPSVPEPGTALAGVVLAGLCGTQRRRESRAA